MHRRQAVEVNGKSDHIDGCADQTAMRVHSCDRNIVRSRTDPARLVIDNLIALPLGQGIAGKRHGLHVAKRHDLGLNIGRVG